MQIRQHRHLGVYGICVANDHVLLVHKARGPYEGLLDLPGGGIEFGEAPETALHREFLEETQIAITTLSLLRTASILIRHLSDDGVTEDLHHLGLLYSVTAMRDANDTLPTPLSVPDGEDSNGAIWMRLSDIDRKMLTPFAQLALDDATTSIV